MAKTITMQLTAQEFFLLKSAMEELCNDSDLIWGGPDDHADTYHRAGKLLERLEHIEQTEVVTH